MKNKLNNVYISEVKDLLVITKEFSNGKLYCDEISQQGVEEVEWHLNEIAPKDILIGKAMPVYGVVDKDAQVLTEQLPFYFEKDFAISAAQQMNKGITEKKKPYKVRKAYLIYPL